MSSSVKFFEPSTVTGPWSDWEINTGSNPNLTSQRAQALSQDGDEYASAIYGTRISYTESFVAKTYTGTAGLTIPKAGQISGGAHVDSVTVKYSQTEYPTLEVASHKHCNSSGTAQTHGTCRTYTGSVKLPARAIGVPTTLTDTAATPNTIFTCPTGVGMRSITYALSVTHTDEMNSDGFELAGEDRDGVETLTLEFTGEIVTSELSISSDWQIESDADSMSNTAVTTKTVTLTKHITKDATSST